MWLGPQAISYISASLELTAQRFLKKSCWSTNDATAFQNPRQISDCCACLFTKIHRHHKICSNEEKNHLLMVCTEWSGSFFWQPSNRKWDLHVQDSTVLQREISAISANGILTREDGQQVWTLCERIHLQDSITVLDQNIPFTQHFEGQPFVN